VQSAGEKTDKAVKEGDGNRARTKTMAWGQTGEDGNQFCEIIREAEPAGGIRRRTNEGGPRQSLWKRGGNNKTHRGEERRPLRYSRETDQNRHRPGETREIVHQIMRRSLSKNADERRVIPPNSQQGKYVHDRPRRRQKALSQLALTKGGKPVKAEWLRKEAAKGREKVGTGPSWRDSKRGGGHRGANAKGPRCLEISPPGSRWDTKGTKHITRFKKHGREKEGKA